MFAVIKTGGKQYRVAAEDTITVMSLAGAPGDAVAFDQVLMLSNGGSAEVGAPFVAGASVSGEIVEQARGPKVIAFKKRRRKNSKRKRGHRQDLTVVRITDILTGGAGLAAQASGQAAESPASAPPEGAAGEPLVAAEAPPSEAPASAEQGPDQRT